MNNNNNTQAKNTNLMAAVTVVEEVLSTTLTVKQQPQSEATFVLIICGGPAYIVSEVSGLRPIWSSADPSVYQPHPHLWNPMLSCMSPQLAIHLHPITGEKIPTL
jgi:hypothetical protein